MVPYIYTKNLINNFLLLKYSSYTVIFTFNIVYLNLIKKLNKSLRTINFFFFNTKNVIYDCYNSSAYSFFFLFKNIYLKPVIKYYSYLHIYYWLKITFRGKGFRVRKFFKSKKMTFHFGRSHWTKCIFQNVFFKIFKIRRQNYIVITLFKKSLYKLMFCLRYIKLINWYTKRGLRVKKQKIKKRFGKISQIVSSLHF